MLKIIKKGLGNFDFHIPIVNNFRLDFDNCSLILGSNCPWCIFADIMRNIGQVSDSCGDRWRSSLCKGF